MATVITMNPTYIAILIIFTALILGFITTTGIKSQWIRLVDIFIIGPLMIYLGFNAIHQQEDNSLQNENLIWLYYVLIFFGATTITYNLRNYLYIM
jgi:hypothetical protein